MLEKIKYRLHVVKQLHPYTKGVRKYLALSFLFSLIVMILGFINPRFYKIFINDVILYKQFEKMNIVVCGYLGIFLLKIIIVYLKNYCDTILLNTTVYRIKFDILQNYLHYPFLKYETASIGDMKMRLEDDSVKIKAFASFQTINYIISAVKILVCLVIMFIIDWRLSIFSMLVIPLTLCLDNIISKKEKMLNDSNRENEQKMSTWLHSSLNGWREIKALNIENQQKRTFLHFLYNYALYHCKWINYWTLRVLVIPKIKNEMLMQFALYFLGGILIINGNLGIGDMFVFIIYYEMLSSAVQSFSSIDAELLANMPYTDRLLKALDNSGASNSYNGVIPDQSNTISLENVCFTYPKTTREVISNVNIKITKGERVAITGKSGSGKTTLLKLMTGMLTPTKGNVSFSGIDLKEIDLFELHKRIGFVMQQNNLFNTSIRENLLYGKTDASENEMRIACEKAYILDFIDKLPEGLDTIIGDNGIKLSGGQKQRLVLARLFLRNVDVFIFDEATSALDQYSESIVYDALKKIDKEKTIIIVSHRESSIALCDRKITI